MAHEWENRLALVGRLLAAPQLRVSPAGIPIARFVIEHESELPEGKTRRRQRFRIGVRAVGEGLCTEVRELQAEALVRVAGHLTRSTQRNEDYRLLIAAQSIKVLAATDTQE